MMAAVITCPRCGLPKADETTDHGGFLPRISARTVWWCSTREGLRIDGKPSTPDQLRALLEGNDTEDAHGDLIAVVASLMLPL